MNGLLKWMMLVCLLAMPVIAADPAPKVITAINEKDGSWVGQSVTMQVELKVPGYFSGVPMFDLPEVPGALIIPPTGSPVVSSEEIDRVSYTTQLYDFTVFPKRAGTMEVPSFEIRLEFKRTPTSKEMVDATVETQALTLTAKQPPGSNPTEDPLTSTDLTVTETWNPEPGAESKPGDAYVRKIIWNASDVPGMAFPPLRPKNIAGLAIYPGEPVVEDTSERGESHGSRTDTVTYVCKTGGDFLIPEKIIRWWDPAKKTMREVKFPARHLRVVAPPIPPEPTSVRVVKWLRHHGWATAGWLLALAAASLAVWIFRQNIVRFWKCFFPRHLEPLNPGLPGRSDVD